MQDKLAPLKLDSLVIQSIGESGAILRYIASNEDLNEKVMVSLRELNKNTKQVRVDFVGASVSNEIKNKAITSVFLGIIGIALYIAWAFRKVSYPISSWQYGSMAVVALFHDILITVGVFSLLGRFMGIEVGVSFVAAILTILGYSINDTIVVYDRTRENLMRSSLKKENFEQIVDRSLNETLARSINTTLTVVIVLVAIFFFGGASLKDFSLALLVGISFGAYSSIFVASALLVSSYHFQLKQMKK
jgi:preprotein translocase subunit SecF